MLSFKEQLFIEQFQKQSFPDVLRRFSEEFLKLHKKVLVLEPLFKKLAGSRTATLLKKTPTKVFSCEVCEIFKNTFFFYRTLPVTASAFPVAASVFFGNLVMIMYLVGYGYDLLIIFFFPAHV